MRYTEHTPTAPPLAGCIETLFVFEGYSPEHPRERVVPDGRIHLIVALDDRERYVFDNESGEPIVTCRGAWLSGVHANYFTIGDTRPESALAVTQFAPGRARALLHRDLSELNDRVIPATALLGTSVNELRRNLLRAVDAEARIGVLEAYWGRRYDSRLDAPAPLIEAVGRIVASPGDLAITRWVEQHTPFSYKHFVSLFKRHVGPTPKRLQRILRFRAVFEMIQGPAEVDWAQLALALGYADQSHFVRDFVEFSGYRPTAFLAEGHERANFFPEEER